MEIFDAARRSNAAQQTENGYPVQAKEGKRKSFHVS